MHAWKGVSIVFSCEVFTSSVQYASAMEASILFLFLHNVRMTFSTLSIE
jgi:hypothetical protein